jgi:transposase
MANELEDTSGALLVITAGEEIGCEGAFHLARAGVLERFPAGLNLFAMGGFLTAANQIRSSLSVVARTNMAKGYSTDLRTRAVALVEAGESRREVARLLDLAASTTIRWMDLWQTTGSVAAKPGTGHCHSPLEQHEQWLLDLVTAEPDLTLDEIGTRLASTKKLKVGRTSVWRFYDRHRITFKKNTARRRTGSA